MFLQALLVLATVLALALLARGPGRSRRAWAWAAGGGAGIALIGFALRSPWVVAAGLACGGAALIALTAPRRRRAKEPTATARARALLGVAADADAAAIRAAWRRKMAQAHPDAGGDPEAAKRLVAARDLLLRQAGENRPADAQDQ